MKELLKKLREAALKATPGERHIEYSLSYCHPDVVKAGLCSHEKGASVEVVSGKVTEFCLGSLNYNWARVLGVEQWTSSERSPRNNLDKSFLYARDAELAALCSPENILALCELAEAARELAEFVANSHPDGNPIFSIEKARAWLAKHFPEEKT